ncbi:MAG: S1 RNA-binding domain-containing protein [Thermosipho sp. (in: Bacteria)]|nr:S1 RNA-binding domain-containing protein [Thermosipho sp. (in: thermotogales)]
MKRFEEQYKPDELLMTVNSNNPTSDAEILQELQAAMNSGKTLVGYVQKCTSEGNLEVKLSENLIGIVPRNEVSWKVADRGMVHLDFCRKRVGLNIQFKVKDIKEEDGKIVPILSRKDAMIEIRDMYFEKIEPGMIVTGVVTGWQEWGAFIDIGGDVEGVIPVQDIARVYVGQPGDILRVGQVLDVVVTKIKKDGEVIKPTLSRKELLADWDEIDNYYKKGDTIIGTVGQMIDTGIFVRLDESFEGLADFAPGRTFKKGEQARVRIVDINKERKKIKLRFV